MTPVRPPLVLRRLTLAAATSVLAVLGTTSAALADPPPSQSATLDPSPETGVAWTAGRGHSADRREAARLARLAQERADALAALDRRAERYSREKAERLARLATYGVSGDLTAVLPLSGYRLTAGFGGRGALWASTHTGTDLAAPTGTTLVAIGDAVVTEVGDAGAYGLRTILTLPDGTQLWYCHQSAALVSPGDVVEVAQPIGAVGSSGNTTGPHLHLEVRPGGGAPVDPVPWLQARGLTP